ncbi:unnamed protein product, partial [Effrenium voratum]
MEVCLLNAENVPDGCLLSISAGGSRRQAPLAAKQKFAFSNSSFAAAVAAGGSGLKVDLLSVKGSACVGSSELLPGLQKAFGAGSAGEGTGHELEVVMPQAGDEELMKLNFFIKPAKKEDREHDMIPPSGPSTFRESEVMPTDYLKQSVLLDRTLPLPPGPKAHSQSSTMRPSRRHHAALQARSYLEDHNILPFVERLLKTLVQERPVDPWGAIAALLPEVAFPELNKKGQLEKLDEEPEASPKHWNLMPSVGTWYMIPKPAKDQACHASKEEAPVSAREEERAEHAAVAGRFVEDIVSAASTRPRVHSCGTSPMESAANTEVERKEPESKPEPAEPEAEAKAPPLPTGKSEVGVQVDPSEFPQETPRAEPDVPAPLPEAPHQRLREHAAAALLKAAEDGTLEAVLSKKVPPASSSEAPHQRLREHAAATLLAAAADGTLEAALSKRQQEQPEVPAPRPEAPHQRLREQAAATLLAAAADGTLEAVLSKKQQEPAQPEVPAPRPEVPAVPMLTMEQAQLAEDERAVAGSFVDGLILAGMVPRASQSGGTSPMASLVNFEDGQKEEPKEEQAEAQEEQKEDKEQRLQQAMGPLSNQKVLTALVQASFEDLDSNRDGVITREEFDAFVAKVKAGLEAADSSGQSAEEAPPASSSEERLRQNAAATLLKAAEDGTLEAVLSKKALPASSSEAPHQRLRQHAAATLLKASEDGTLAAVLSKKQQVQMDPRLQAECEHAVSGRLVNTIVADTMPRPSLSGGTSPMVSSAQTEIGVNVINTAQWRKVKAELEAKMETAALNNWVKTQLQSTFEQAAQEGSVATMEHSDGSRRSTPPEAAWLQGRVHASLLEAMKEDSVAQLSQSTSREQTPPEAKADRWLKDQLHVTLEEALREGSVATVEMETARESVPAVASEEWLLQSFQQAAKEGSVATIDQSDARSVTPPEAAWLQSRVHSGVVEASKEESVAVLSQAESRGQTPPEAKPEWLKEQLNATMQQLQVTMEQAMREGSVITMEVDSARAARPAAQDSWHFRPSVGTWYGLQPVQEGASTRVEEVDPQHQAAEQHVVDQLVETIIKDTMPSQSQMEADAALREQVRLTMDKAIKADSVATAELETSSVAPALPAKEDAALREQVQLAMDKAVKADSVVTMDLETSSAGQAASNLLQFPTQAPEGSVATAVHSDGSKNANPEAGEVREQLHLTMEKAIKADSVAEVEVESTVANPPAASWLQTTFQEAVKGSSEATMDQHSDGTPEGKAAAQ